MRRFSFKDSITILFYIFYKIYIYFGKKHGKEEKSVVKELNGGIAGTILV